MKTILINSIVPSVMITVFAMHFYQVKTNHLTPWKGGGFGMYTTIPWSHREVWFMGWSGATNPLDGFEKDAQYVRAHPSRENMLALAEKVKKKYNVSGFTVEVWEPRLKENGAFTRVMLTKADAR